jgi:undecaprenyl phosphate-alpha-L-ara4N flippase subunit ArnE
MRLIVLAVIQSVLLCSGQVFLKFALQKMGTFAWKGSFFLAQLTNWWWLGCGLCYLAATILWMYIVKNYPFSQSYPMISLSYVLGMIAAIAVFHEDVTATRWIGVLLIMGGCFLIAK